MKSYFSKLAARATLTNAPAHAVATPNSRDPFEVEATQPIASPISSKPQSDSQSSIVPGVSDPRLERPEDRSQKGVTTDMSAEQLPPVLRPQVTESERSNPPLPRNSESVNRLEPPSSETRVRSESEPSRTSIVSRATNDSEPQQTAIVLPTVRSTEKPATRPQEKDESIDRLAQLQRDQSILLRKADAFMANALVRDEVSNHRQEEQAKNTRNSESIKPEKTREPAQTRIRPATPSPRVSEPVNPEPSVVIGKISVEVVPPTPTPVTPQTRVIVVGGGQRTREGIPSSQRFGFSRF